MKKFSKYITENKISDKITLENLPKNIIEKLKYLEGKVINECCCCCGDCCCDPCSKTGSISENPFVYYHSQQEIVNKLKTDIKVQDIYNIHSQFDNRFKFRSSTPAEAKEVLYFKEITYANEPYSYYNNYISNQKLYNFIQGLCNKFKLGYPTVLDSVDGKLQIFFNTNRGSNGAECSIKSSLIAMVQILNGLEEYKEITWAQILDVSIDNADDVYDFVITIMVEPTEFKKEESEETKTLKVVSADEKTDEENKE